LTLAEFAEGMAVLLGVQVTAGELRQMFEAFDKDGDCCLRLDEFSEMLKQASDLAPQIEARLRQTGMEISF
jgi:Ca2+-binding EF-hand superfamily protein